MLRIHAFAKTHFRTALVLGFALALLSFRGVIGAITNGYNTDDQALRPGLVVALSASSTPENPKVERASQDQVERVIGVATTVNDSLVTIASGDQEVFVETDGEIDTYVTNLSGDIAQNDLLSLSPLKGILGKQEPGQPAVAIALEAFSREGAETYTIEDNSGEREVLINKLKINLDQKAVANSSSSTEESSLAQLGRSVVGKDVGELRVIIALIIFFIVLIAEGGIIYGAVSSAITSLGRNPLARNIIKRELIRVLFIAIIVLSMGVASIYAVLWI